MAYPAPVFAPSSEGTSGIAVTGSSAARKIQAANIGLGAPRGASRFVRIYNAGANDVYFAFGGSAVAATVPTNADVSGGSLPVKAGDTAIFACPYEYVAAIASVAGPTQVWLTPGELVGGY